MEALDTLKQVNNKGIMQDNVAKLLIFLKNCWRKEATDTSRRTGSLTEFEIVVDFIKKAAKRAE